MTRQPNSYSPRWFGTFLGEIDESRVAPEVEFLSRQLPRARFPRVLDLCCGPGRHAIPLASRGYAVSALDRDRSVLAALRARSRRPGSNFVDLLAADMTALPIREAAFDGVICMWQSFGYLGESGDAAVLGGMRSVVRAGGRVVLDLYNREFHERDTGVRSFARAGVSVREERVVNAGRLRVHLTYEREGAAVGSDTFEWTLYDVAALARMARRVGLRPLLACSEFDETKPVSAGDARMQLVFAVA